MSLTKGGFLSAAGRLLRQESQGPAVSFSQQTLSLPETAKRIHLIVLVHGWLGNPEELGYLQSSIEKYSERYDKGEHLFYVYSVLGNNGNTSDGIAAGGTRVAQEVNALLEDLANRAEAELSISFVGHSLGGLYSRYALSLLEMEKEGRQHRVQPKVFCTTASPHLGVGTFTYLPIPRAAEYVVASVMQPTGRDLFRFTDIIDRMTSESTFVTPLSRFQKRIAYANAHSTDFQVPTATAAFLADTGSLHHRIKVDQEGPFIGIAVETEARLLDETHNDKNDDEPFTAAQLAGRLDAMGWEKVFFDMRDTLPSLRIPFMAANGPVVAKSEYTSAELLAEYASWKLERIHFPMGHNVLVANSKNEMYAKMNAAGKPV